MDDGLSVTSKDTLTDVAFKACSALAAVGIEAVLCGGSAARVGTRDFNPLCLLFTSI